MRPLVAAVLCFGCIATNRVTLDETAALFHDDLRWGRIPAAETSVDARAREAFQQHHRGWGTQVRVVDLDVDAVRTASSTGMLRVRVTWVGGNDSTDVREREADAMAAESLIPRSIWSRSDAARLRTAAAVESLANELRISTAIVAGRIRRETGNYKILTKHLGQGEVRRHFPDVVWD